MRTPRLAALLALAVAVGMAPASAAPGGPRDLTIGNPNAEEEREHQSWQEQEEGLFEWLDPDAEAEREAERERAALGGETAEPAGADRWFIGQRVFPHETLDIGRSLKAARAQATRLAAKRRPAAAPRAATWQPIGPANVGGRVTDVVADPVHADTVYAGAAGGGVWKSTDAGATFRPAWNPADPPSIGALAITPQGVLYAGTGEGNPGGGSTTFPGNGVFRSADGGATWTHVGLEGTDRIGRLALDPTNANRMFAAAAGNLFVQGGPRGLYRTTDGAKTWQLVLRGANPTTGAIDVAVDPRNPRRVYAAMWDHYRRPSGRHYGGVGSGVFRSTDGGDTWTRLGGGLPGAGPDVGRMGVAVSASNPNRLYAIAAKTPGEFSGFWTSTNGGDSWTAITNTSYLSGSQSSYGWWFGRIWIDPADERHAFVPGVPILETLDAGATWRRSSSVHADQHAMAWDASNPGRVYLGNDGGVYRSQANGSLTSPWTKAKSLPINQFYTVSVSNQDTDRVLGGAQDNGSLRSWGAGAWSDISGGDGTTTLIDPTNHDKVYACSQYGSCGRSTNGGSSMQGFGATTSDRRGWLTPVVFDPKNPQIMYYGGNRLNRSTNSAATWTAISPDLTRGNGGNGGSVFGTITAVAVSASNSAVIYAGTDDGRAWITRNTGASWTEITAGLPTRWITAIVVDPMNANVAYITVSGFASGDAAPHILRTADGGKTWRSVSGDLPDAPVNDLVLDPRNPAVLYAGTDVGTFTSGDGGMSWAPVGTGLPAVPVAGLSVVAVGNTTVLTAATFGLSMYRTTVTR